MSDKQSAKRRWSDMAYPDQRRNLNPIPEARLAMALWSHEYAYEQKGGVMDFWDSRTPSQKRLCRDLLAEIAKAAIAHNVTLEALADHA